MKNIPAFPQSSAPIYGGAATTTSAINSINSQGMSLRDYFAAKALQGLLADHTQRQQTKNFAKASYKLADAMLKARDVK